MLQSNDIFDTLNEDFTEYYPRKTNANQTYYDYNGCYPSDFDNGDNTYLYITLAT